MSEITFPFCQQVYLRYTQDERNFIWNMSNKLKLYSPVLTTNSYTFHATTDRLTYRWKKVLKNIQSNLSFFWKTPKNEKISFCLWYKISCKGDSTGCYGSHLLCYECLNSWDIYRNQFFVFAQVISLSGSMSWDNYIANDLLWNNWGKNLCRWSS